MDVDPTHRTSPAFPRRVAVKMLACASCWRAVWNGCRKSKLIGASIKLASLWLSLDELQSRGKCSSVLPVCSCSLAKCLIIEILFKRGFNNTPESSQKSANGVPARSSV